MSKKHDDDHDHPHRRRELHEDKHGHPHHHQEDHARHHHRVHAPHHKQGETGEEKHFVEHEKYLHTIETNKEIWDDVNATRIMRKSEKLSAAPAQAEEVDPSRISGTPGERKSFAARSGRVAQSSSAQLNEVAAKLKNMRERITFARSQNRQRGAEIFK